MGKARRQPGTTWNSSGKWAGHGPGAQAEKSFAHRLYSAAAVREGEIAGMGRLAGGAVIYWCINGAFVLPAYRGMGIGTRFVNRMADYAKRESLPGSGING